MNNQQLHEKFSELSTPLIADACLRLKIPLRLAPSGIHPLAMESHIADRVLPVTHSANICGPLEGQLRNKLNEEQVAS